jgi:hypothetical protein
VSTRPPKEEHVVVGDNRFKCLHCGDSYNPFAGAADGKGVDLTMFTDMTKSYEKRHRRCPKPSEPRCAACLKLGHVVDDHVRCEVAGAAAWLDCGDTGTSSKMIWSHMQGRPQDPRWQIHPRDPSDFGRCYRLLAAPWAADWRPRIGEMATYSPAWARLAGAWDELEALWLEETSVPDATTAPKLYARMRALIEGKEGEKGT